MVWDGSIKTGERLTGRWWLGLEKFFFWNRIIIFVEIEETYSPLQPSPPGQPEHSTTVTAHRRATSLERIVIATTNRTPRFRYLDGEQ